MVIVSIIISLVLLLNFMTQVVWSYHGYWLWVIGAAVVIFSPLGNKKLKIPDGMTVLNPVQWLSQIFILELSLFAVFWGICVLSGNTLPVFTDVKPPLFSNTIAHTLLTRGLFPWVGVALIASALGYLGFRRDHNTLMANTFFPNAVPDKPFSLIVNTTTRAAMMFALSSTIALITLLIASTLAPTNMNALKETHFAGLIFSCLVLFFMSSKFIKRQSHHLITRYDLSPITALFGLFVFLAFIVIVLALFFGTGFSMKFNTPHFLFALLKPGALLNWQLFAILWWLSWMPVAGLFIARLSRGYSLRAIILATCALPLVFYLLCFWVSSHTIHEIPHWIAMIVSVLGLFGLLTIIAPRHTFAWLTQMMIPKGGALKYRPFDRFIVKISQFSALMLVIYLVGGVALLNVFFFPALIFLSILFLALPLALLVTN